MYYVAISKHTHWTDGKGVVLNIGKTSRCAISVILSLNMRSTFTLPLEKFTVGNLHSKFVHHCALLYIKNIFAMFWLF